MPRAAQSGLRCAALGLLLFTVAGLAEEPSGIGLYWQGREIDVKFSEQLAPTQREVLLEEWLNFVALSLGQVYGRWPREYQQITVTPISAWGDDPIPWAQVHRGKIDRVEFYIAATASPEALKRAWTSYHELAHLLIPYRGWGDTWFSEGLASYYQNLMQARSGLLDEQGMWQKLHDGFQRGQADQDFQGQTLSSVSDKLRREGGFMRVYWSGAWYFLTADARLRMQSGGKLTLDMALEKLNRCCADDALSVPEIVNRLDSLNRVVLFSPLYEQLVDSTEMPPFKPLFTSLGITVTDGRVALQSEGPGARIRREIARGRRN